MSKAAQKRGEHLALLNAAQVAYDDTRNVLTSGYLPTSAMDDAWRIGKFALSMGLPRPHALRPSRGSNYHVTFGPAGMTRIVHVPWVRKAHLYYVE